ncbi:unnamed protein product [Trichogramma brassicae]|uniref:Uncharacterized protein n=1 Tax=Trichogramma brassicae TaxID=86971 RepID=A0A6H5II76_9HYME|nr:unnamed protein product [Trichogramma brassicae]
MARSGVDTSQRVSSVGDAVVPRPLRGLGDYSAPTLQTHLDCIQPALDVRRCTSRKATSRPPTNQRCIYDPVSEFDQPSVNNSERGVGRIQPDRSCVASLSLISPELDSIVCGCRYSAMSPPSGKNVNISSCTSNRQVKCKVLGFKYCFGVIKADILFMSDGKMTNTGVKIYIDNQDDKKSHYRRLGNRLSINVQSEQEGGSSLSSYQLQEFPAEARRGCGLFHCVFRHRQDEHNDQAGYQHGEAAAAAGELHESDLQASFQQGRLQLRQRGQQYSHDVDVFYLYNTNKICPALPVMVNIKLCEDCQSESDGDASGGACVRCTGCENLIHKYALRVKAVTLCSQCKRWSAPEDRSLPISHSSAPVSRISSPSSSQFTCSTKHSASLESLSLKRPRDSPPTAFCVKRTYIQLSESVPPVSPCQPGPPSEMSDDSTPPPWVSTLLSRFDRLETSMNGRLASIEASLLEFSRTQHQHTASIEHNTNSIAGLDGRVTAEIATIRSDNDRAFTAMRAEIGRACVQSRAAAAAAPVADHDTCEVRVSGIPLSVDVTSSATAERIVSALELDRLRPHILSVREWAPRRRTPVAAPSTSNAVLDLEMKTMVIRFPSANARETFLAAAPKFQRLSTHAIFGIADDGRPNHLRANVILPSDRHRLYRRCAVAAEAHGYPRPFVRNLCIYMRRARDSAPICIMSDDDLALLVSRPNETVTSWKYISFENYCANGFSVGFEDRNLWYESNSLEKCPL